jgi:hypothetical protein
MAMIPIATRSTGRTGASAADPDHDEFNVPRSFADDETPASILRAEANPPRRGGSFATNDSMP